MSLTASIRSIVPGRVRLGQVRPKGEPWDDVNLGASADDIAKLDGVVGIESSFATRSVLIYHTVPSEELFDAIRDLGVIDIVSEEPVQLELDRPSERMARALRRSLDKADRVLIEGTSNQMDLRSATFAGCVTLAAWQAVRGKFLPAGLTLVSIGIGIVAAAAALSGTAASNHKDDDVRARLN